VAITTALGPVVVGVLGSQAALSAVEWAVLEAAGRRVTLRLVHAVDHSSGIAGYTAQFAVEALRTAGVAANAYHRQLDIETAVVHGPPLDVLLAESAFASLLCVGTDGARPRSGTALGPTAEALVARSQCPLAVVRALPPRSPESISRIVLSVNRSDTNSAAAELAMAEAALRGLPLLAVGARHRRLGRTPIDTVTRQLDPIRWRYPGLRVETVATACGIVEFLADHPGEARLVVVDDTEADAVTSLIGDQFAARRGAGECCVLIAR